MREFILLENGTKAFLSRPYQAKPNYFFVERDKEMTELRKCLLSFDSQDNTDKRFPLLYGPPGVGKTELCLRVSDLYGNGKPLWVFQGHSEISPEMIVFGTRLVPPNSERTIGEYFLSGITSSMVEGGYCLVDEVGKIRPESLSLLNSILSSNTDFLEGTSLGLKFREQPGFRIMFTSQSNEIGNLPEEFKDRLKLIEVPLPTENEINKILKIKYQRYNYDHEIEKLTDLFWILWRQKKGKQDPTLRMALNIFSDAQRHTAIERMTSRSLDNVPFLGISETNLKHAFESIDKPIYG